MKLRTLFLGFILLLSFSMAHGQRNLSVPSQTISPGSNVTVTVNLSQGDGVGGVQFDLLFDSSFLRIFDSDGDGNLGEEVLKGTLPTADHLMVTNASQPGRISVVLAGTTSFNAGGGSVVSVPFQVLAAAGSTVLNLGNVILSDPLGSALPVSSANGTLTIQGGNNQQPNAVADSATTAEDTSTTISVLSNDSDPDGGNLSVSSVTQPPNGTASIQGGTAVRYTPRANFFGNDSFTYTISDGQGGSDSASVAVTVTPVNDPPTAVADSRGTTEGEAVTVNVLANDRDVDGDSLSVVSATQGSHGTVVINSGQTVTYTPQAGFIGSDSFSYTVSDGHNGSASAQVTISVSGNTEPPNAVADSATTAEDTPVTVNVLNNDSDPDGGILSVVSVTPPAHGSAAIQNGTSVRYSPAPNYFGSDSFNYTVSDGQGGVNTASVSVTVTPVNDAPTAVADSASTISDEAVIVHVLANDSDVDGDALSIISVTQGSDGSVSINGDQSLTYTPGPGFSGSDSFGYTVGDGKGGIASAQVVIEPSSDYLPTLAFPQFVDGGDPLGSLKPNTSRMFIRNNSDQEATVRIHFRTGEGLPLSVPVLGEVGEFSVFDRTIAPFGLTQIETAGTGQLKFGVVDVETLSGDPAGLDGTLVFSLFGTFVSIDSSPLRDEHPVLVSYDPAPILGENTGIALYNPDFERPATVRLSLRDALGSEVTSRRTIQIGPRQQLLGFVTEEDFFAEYFESLGEPFLGSLHVSVTQGGPDLAVLGLVQKTDAFDSALVAISSEVTGEGQLFFPQFVNGGDASGSPLANSSRILVRNTSDQVTQRVFLSFFDSSGNRVQIPIEGRETDRLAKEISPLGVSKVQTDGTGDSKFGVVELRAEGSEPVSGTLVYSLFGTFVSVGSSPLRSGHEVFVSVDGDPVFGENTGVAVYNPSSDQTMTVQLGLRDEVGDEVAPRKNVAIGPRGQLLRFVTEGEFFKDYFDTLSEPFLGTLTISVVGGADVAVLGMIQKKEALDSALIAVSTVGAAVQ